MIRKGNRIELRDEGVFKGIVRALDLVGIGAAATVSGDTGTLDLTGTLPLSGGVLSGNLDLDGNDLIINAAGTTLIDDDGAGLLRTTVLGNVVSTLTSAGVETLTQIDAGAAPGPTVTLLRDSASPAVADDLGEIIFQGRDSSAALQTYARIWSRIDVPTATVENGQIRFAVSGLGTETLIAQMKSSGFRLPYLASASRALYADANKDIQTSSVTDTELGYLSGVTSAIQTQINAAGGGFALLNTYTPSGAASVDVTSQITGTYDRYLIAYDLRVATDNVNLYLRTDSNNGASFDSGATDYQYAGNNTSSAGTNAAFGSTGAAQILLTQTGVGNATNEGVSGVIFLTFKGSASMYPQFVFDTAFANLSTNFNTSRGGGFRASAAAIDAVQLLTSSGNLTGTVRIYGIKN